MDLMAEDTAIVWGSGMTVTTLREDKPMRRAPAHQNNLIRAQRVRRFSTILDEVNENDINEHACSIGQR